VFRKSLVLAVLLSGTARGAGPVYSAAGIVNTANYTAAPFAPNSVVTIFGSGLAHSKEGVSLPGGAVQLPYELNYARVYVSNREAPLLYASDSQINFLIPPDLGVGNVAIRVAVQGLTVEPGPEITVALVAAAPALFSMAGGYAIATHADGTLMTADSPAHGGDTIVIYLTGLGLTSPNPAPGEVPHYAAQIVQLSQLKVLLNGSPVDPVLIKYAGLTPGSAGLYQINLYIPNEIGADPEIRVAVGAQSSPAGLKLPIR